MARDTGEEDREEDGGGDGEEEGGGEHTYPGKRTRISNAHSTHHTAHTAHTAHTTQYRLSYSNTPDHGSDGEGTAGDAAQ